MRAFQTPLRSRTTASSPEKKILATLASFLIASGTTVFRIFIVTSRN